MLRQGFKTKCEAEVYYFGELVRLKRFCSHASLDRQVVLADQLER